MVGTHALIQEGVAFGRLGLAVVDEQHRFGVLQREDLRKKGYDADVLVMTATPIPRTLALTAYGDLDVSIVDEKPAGPHADPHRRCARPPSAREVLDLVKRAVAQGGRPTSSTRSSRSRRSSRTSRPRREASRGVGGGPARRARGAPPRPDEERREGRGDGRLLPRARSRCSSRPPSSRWASTCPNATVMVIEHAERFGLAQLHQLRGRVGRGAASSFLRAPRPTGGCPRWPARGSTSWSRPRTASRSRRRTSRSAARATSSAPGSGGCRPSAWPTSLRDRDLLERARTEAFRLVGRGRPAAVPRPLPREGRLGAPLRPGPRRVTAAHSNASSFLSRLALCSRESGG